MIQQTNEAFSDNQLLEGFSYEDIHKETLRGYRQELKCRSPYHPWNELDDIAFLEKIGACRNREETGETQLTVAGLLMFGKEEAIRKRFKNLHMDFINESYMTGACTWDTGNNNLYSYFRNTIVQLTYGLPCPFKLVGIVRIDDTPVMKAVREATINMIIHADYEHEGLIKALKKDNAFYFTNPGSLQIPTEMIYKGVHSDVRNPTIQKMFQLTGFGNHSPGFSNILEAWNEENWRLPDIDFDKNSNQFDLKLLMIPKDSEIIRELPFFQSEIFKELDLSEKMICSAALVEEGITFKRLQSLFDLGTKELETKLSKLQQKHFLKATEDSHRIKFFFNREILKDFKPESPKDHSNNSQKYLFTTEKEKLVYEFLEENKFITTTDVRKITDITSRQGAGKFLNRLVKKGLLVRNKEGRKNLYRLRLEI